MKAVILVAILSFSSMAFSDSKNGVVREPAQTHTVRGYTKSNGTYVAPYIRSNPDGIKSNNIRR